jgi:hypothetical protein
MSSKHIIQEFSWQEKLKGGYAPTAMELPPSNCFGSFCLVVVKNRTSLHLSIDTGD